MTKLWIPHAHNRYVARLLRLFPERVFQELHRWPTHFSCTEKRVTFCLSFDCDNPTDADFLPALLSQLRRYGISASFAVCGAMVEENVKAYEQVITEGHEIINHGYSKHLEVLSDGSVRSTLFYDKLSENQIEEEIVRNHESLQNVLGITPIGFRVPHFGTFQAPHHIDLLHSLLKKYGYRYSSSVLMLYAKQRGYLGADEGIVEFPLSARVGAPLSVFDSWGFLRAPGRRFTDADFFPEFQRMMDVALKAKYPMFLNIYFDPSHVVGFDGFEACLRYVNKNNTEIWTGTYSAILGSSK